MTKKKSSTEKELKATVKKLRTQLDRADAKVERLQKKNDRLAKTLAASESRAKTLVKTLDKVNRKAARTDEGASAKPAKTSTSKAAKTGKAAKEGKAAKAGKAAKSAVAKVTSDAPVVAPEPVTTVVEPEPLGEQSHVVGTASDLDSSAAVPDSGWTVVQLRAEARARGLTGVSGKPKDQLLAALS